MQQVAVDAHRRWFYRFDKKKYFIYAAQFRLAFKLQKNIDSHIEQAKQVGKSKVVLYGTSSVAFLIDFAEKNLRYTLLNQEILEKYPNLIVVKSISKSYGVPGLRLGVLANADANLIQQIKKTNSIWNINSFGEYYLQIYEKYSKTYASACDKIADERNRFIKELSSKSGKFCFM